MSVGVVAALAAEARTLGTSMRRPDGLAALADGTLLAVCGMGCEAASIAARALADAGAAALVSWGVAGGLDPSLPAGTVCLPSIVISAEGSFTTDAPWRTHAAAVAAVRRRVVSGTLLTRAHAIADVIGKAAAFRATGAAAVDMESAAIADVAAQRALPFLAVRVIVDSADDRVPDAVLAAGGDGRVRVLRLLLTVLRSPGDIAALVRLARRYRAALESLTAVARTAALVVPVSRTAPPAGVAPESPVAARTG